MCVCVTNHRRLKTRIQTWHFTKIILIHSLLRLSKNFGMSFKQAHYSPTLETDTTHSREDGSSHWSFAFPNVSRRPRRHVLDRAPTTNLLLCRHHKAAQISKGKREYHPRRTRMCGRCLSLVFQMCSPCCVHLISINWRL